MLLPVLQLIFTFPFCHALGNKNFRENYIFQLKEATWNTRKRERITKKSNLKLLQCWSGGSFEMENLARNKKPLKAPKWLFDWKNIKPRSAPSQSGANLCVDMQRPKPVNLRVVTRDQLNKSLWWKRFIGPGSLKANVENSRSCDFWRGIRASN